MARGEAVAGRGFLRTGEDEVVDGSDESVSARDLIVSNGSCSLVFVGAFSGGLLAGRTGSGRSDVSEAWSVSGSRTAEGSRILLGRAAGKAMIICQAGKETRHWRAVGDEQFAKSAKGKTTSCVWMAGGMIDPKIRVAIQGVASALAQSAQGLSSSEGFRLGVVRGSRRRWSTLWA